MKSRNILSSFLIICAACAWAQQPPDDPLREYLFPPELVMQNQQAIGLSEEQKLSLKTAQLDALVEFTKLQWKLQTEMERMISLLKQSKVDEQQVLGQLDKVLAAEREVKREQIQLLIRIKNTLKPEQQAKLRELQKK